MIAHRVGWLVGWVALMGLTVAAGTVGFAQEVDCAKPIAPCKACHSPAATRELARCLAEPWVAPASAKELKNPFPSSPEILNEGKGLYKINCEGCHGPQGDGQGLIAVKFSVPAVNISAPTVQAQTDGELFWKISTGRGAMSAWSTMFTDEDIWKLVTFVRTFQSR